MNSSLKSTLLPHLFKQEIVIFADPSSFFLDGNITRHIITSALSATRLRQHCRFTKKTLPYSLQGFASQDGKGGKRAMRVYPPWDITDSPQAKKTQA